MKRWSNSDLKQKEARKRIQAKYRPKPRKKPLRSTGLKSKPSKPKKCKECLSVFAPSKPLQIVCSPKCAIAYAQKHLKKKQSELSKIKLEGFKEKTKTLSDYEAEARKVFQKWIVKVRDKTAPCIACGSQNADEYNGSHYYEAGQYSGLIFDEMNVHKCCIYCNKHRHGNLLMYREGIILRYGQSYLDELEAKKNEGRNKKFVREELISIKNKYSALLKDGNKK